MEYSTAEKTGATDEKRHEAMKEASVTFREIRNVPRVRRCSTRCVWAEHPGVFATAEVELPGVLSR